MHSAIIRLIARRETLDLLRDRRTLFMIFFLPVALYPLLGVFGLLVALGSADQKSRLGIDGADSLPQNSPTAGPAALVLPAASWLTAVPGGLDQLTGAAALALTAEAQLDYPPLLIDGQIAQALSGMPGRPVRALVVVPLADDGEAALADGRIDVLLRVPTDFARRLASGERSTLELRTRDGDEQSRLAERRLRGVLDRWQQQVKQVRLLRRGLPADYDEPFTVKKPQDDDEPLKAVGDELSDMLGRFFPFLLIMWALAGALHPAIDVTAGEKERGTLETLLLSPASRGEIVCGKFLAIWAFSAATALWNLFWLGGAAWGLGFVLPVAILRFGALLWCAVISVLLAALFSAVSMALGAYARSTKEGQYYLLPLFVVTMPLTFLPLAPGVELNWYYSLVPITGATLLLQKLMLAQSSPVHWVYFPLVLSSLAVCCALALGWAVRQFQREEVLFREAHGTSRGWLRWARRS
ncbi:MAG: ABC transporter permease [Planctomycetia bacterium]|nr:ABC transporter permease [Planctomycetia bacterium]